MRGFVTGSMGIFLKGVGKYLLLFLGRIVGPSVSGGVPVGPSGWVSGPVSSVSQSFYCVQKGGGTVSRS